MLAGVFHQGLETGSTMRLYVATTGSDTNDGLSSTAPFATIAKAISVIPYIVNHTVNINVAGGTYNEYVNISGFCGKGQINIIGDTTTTVSIINLTSYNVAVGLYISNLTATVGTGIGFYFALATGAHISNCVCTGSSVADGSWGIQAYKSRIYISGCTFSNRWAGIRANAASHVYAYAVAGTGNQYGSWVSEGSVVTINSCSLTGTTQVYNTSGGLTCKDGVFYGQLSELVAADGSTEHIELRKTLTTAGPAFLDFHTSGNSIDYDSRIIAEGGSTTVGSGKLTLTANEIILSGPVNKALTSLWVNPQTAYGATPTLTMPIGDSDTGFNWVSDGRIDIYSNNTRAATLQDGWLTLKGPDSNFYSTANFWGTHTTGTRSTFRAAINSASFATGTYTKITGFTEFWDNKGEFDPTTGTFTPAEGGIYALCVYLYFGGTVTDQARVTIRLYKNGASDTIICDTPQSGNTSLTAAGLLLLDIAAGVPCTFYLWHNSSSSITSTFDSARSSIFVMRVS